MIFHIALKDLIITFKDRKALIVMLLMPILIILILGSALGNMFSNDSAIKKFSIAIVNNDEGGDVSKQFIDFLRGKDMEKIFDVQLKGEKEAKELLEKKQVTSVVTLPKDFSSNIHRMEKVKIGIESLSDEKIKAGIVESITNGFAQGASIIGASSSTIVEESKKYQIPLTFDANGQPQLKEALYELQMKISTRIINFTEQEQEKNKSLSALQYYSAGMLLMFILFGANMGTMLLVEERETRTLGRLMTTGISKGTLIIGKFLGLLFICLAQAVILILFTALVYGVYWGGNVFEIAMITFCSVFAGAAMGMFIAAVSKTQKAAQGFSQIFIQISTVIGGGMIPIYVMPQAMQQLSKITVNYWGTKGYIDLMMGTGGTTLLQYSGILVAMGIIYLTIGIAKFRVE